MIPTRRDVAKLALGLAALPLGSLARAQGSALTLLTAGQGSAFLPYGRGLAKVIAAAGAGPVDVAESRGSNDNLAAVEADPMRLGFAFLASAYEAVNGTGPFAGRPQRNLRALAPMYETSFQFAARRASGIGSVRALEGRRVGVGPQGGPQEVFFNALSEVAGIRASPVTGQPAELGRALVAGEIDAFWQGASVPIPSLVTVLGQTEALVFGLTEEEVAGMRARFPYMAAGEVPAGTYAGQTAPLRSVTAWNVVIAHRDLPEERAYALARAILSAADLPALVGPPGASTKAQNATFNTVVPYHPGAVRYLAEVGVRVASA